MWKQEELQIINFQEHNLDHVGQTWVFVYVYHKLLIKLAYALLSSTDQGQFDNFLRVKYLLDMSYSMGPSVMYGIMLCYLVYGLC